LSMPSESAYGAAEHIGGTCSAECPLNEAYVRSVVESQRRPDGCRQLSYM